MMAPCYDGLNLTDGPTIRREPRKIIPAFGWHPWFSHHMFDEAEFDGALQLTEEQKLCHYQRALCPMPEDGDFVMALPNPIPFRQFLNQTKKYLERYPLALVGEVGLDRSFRIPEAPPSEEPQQRDDMLTPGGREGRRLSQYRVQICHQKAIFSAQLRLAGEMQRAVSAHGVQAHGAIYEAIAATWKGFERSMPSRKERKRRRDFQVDDINADGTPSEPSAPAPKPFPPRICLHSFSGPAETVKQYIAPTVPCEVFFSFSTTINKWSDVGDGKVEAAVAAVPDDRILIESDFHAAGDCMDYYLVDVTRKISRVKGWSVEDGAKQLGRNWRKFVFGKDASKTHQAN